MECTKCKKRLDISYYSLKNIKYNIYYLNCDICREKIINQKNKKDIEIYNYINTKNNKYILCKCGKEYIAFREFHIIRHESTNYHIKNILNK